MGKYSHGNYDGPNGIHGVPLWRLAGFVLNNTSSNCYLLTMGYITFFLNGPVGASVFLAGSFAMMMRIFDGITDPFVAMIVDKTNGKFGKNRPFMLIGNLTMLVSTLLMFRLTPVLPQVVRVPWFIFINIIYYLGYTCQCIVTKSGQTCLTNDPSQRPLFALFDGILNMLLFTGLGIWISSVLVPKYGAMSDARVFQEMNLYLAPLSLVLMLAAMFSIAPKDNSKYFGTGQAQKVTFKDYVDVLTHNRAIQMLVLSASTDKLGMQAKTSVATVILYGIVAGNFALSGLVTGFTTIPNFLFLFFGVGIIATRLGQKRAMLVGSLGGCIGNLLMMLLWYVGDPTTLSLPGDGVFTGFNLFTILFLALMIVSGGLSNISANIVIPMTADCADYETYRSGKYLPGLMGSLFSFVDKMVSSFAPLIASLLLMAIGFTETMPDVSTPMTPQLKFVGVFLSFGLLAICSGVNLIAMKFYPLNREKMAEIQDEIAAIKARAAAAEA